MAIKRVETVVRSAP